MANWDGGAIFNGNGGTLTETNSTFTSNTAPNGGAIWSYGTITETSSTFTCNNATDSNGGGAIYNLGTLNDTNNTFTNNNAENNGGAIYNDGTQNDNNNTYTSNTASWNGGATYNDGILNNSNNTFTGNNATNNGGAISNEGTINDNNSTYTDNTAEDGGAIYNKYYGTISITNNTYTYNTAEDGGAIYNDYLLSESITYAGNLTDFNSTFTHNNAIMYGGAIYNDGYALVNFNRIIGNTANTGYAIFNDIDGTIDATLNWWGYNNDPGLRGDIVNNGGTCNYDPWIVLTIIANPTSVLQNGNSIITIDLLHDNNNGYHDPANGLVPYTGLINLSTSLGTIVNANMFNGEATSLLNAGSILGVANVSATVDFETVNVLVNIIPPLTIISINPILSATNVSHCSSNHYHLQQSYTIRCHLQLYKREKFRGIGLGIKTAYSNNILTITANYGWTSGTTYTINLPAYSIESTGGAQLRPAYTSNFTTATPPPNPTVTSIVPTSGVNNITTTQVITITFSSPIQAGSAYGNINVKNAAGVSAGITKTINGNNLTITANYGWTPGTTYTINLPTNCINSTNGAPLAAAYTSNFTTATPPPNPTVTSIVPTSGVNNITTTQVITITFSSPIQAGSAYGNINVKNAAGVSAGITKTINGNNLTITANYGWTPGTTYTINLPTNCINSTNGAPLAAAYTSNFTTATPPPNPTVTSIYPDIWH